MKLWSMSEIHNIESYRPSSNDVLFFDNNIWMYLYCPIGNYQKEKQQKYSTFFKYVCSAKSCIWINSLVLSEFCNAWLKIEFDNWKKKPENIGKSNYKKDFVQSVAYKEVVQEIKLTIPNLLKNTEKCSDNFNFIDFNLVLASFENCDFNDSYYLTLAHTNKWKIVTDDADFFNNSTLNVEIITANYKK
jgi:predicted nucleic acid-binding protein